MVTKKTRSKMWKVLLVIPFFIAIGGTDDCVPTTYGGDKIVCVCNATYCDTVPEKEPLQNGTFYSYTSSKAGLRMNVRKGEINSCQQKLGSVTLTIDSTKKYQKILGFGGAFTDSAGININKLSNATQEQLLRAYYDPVKGSGYSLGRIGFGSTDFSSRFYTYDDHPDDAELKYFSLATEDYKYKIPYMKKALELNPKTKFFAAIWSPPVWMKTNNKPNGGFLKIEHYATYASYITKSVAAYTSNNITIWAVSTGNEPLNAYIPFDRLSSMGWTPGTVATWVADYLGPTLAASGHGTEILALDDQRIELPWAVDSMFNNEKAKDYISGVAVHWYADFISSPQVLDKTHNNHPDKFILLTEACEGTGLGPHVDLGSWDRGQAYILSIIEYLNHWSVGWVDWNLALDKSGGPNIIDNYVDSPIIVNPENDEFYKQPMYYALQHVSKFIDRGSQRISITDTIDIKSTAFTTPSNEVVVVLYNKNFIPRNVILKDSKKGSICVELPAYSMNTIVYKQ
ncbi:lysosomal acid glucosylceramidase-like isoform X1 [Megachile rotundata]|uniref:lysosomal acid glucosylceramidase-like isoform X1 n=1 Tax=Megachile rotundata TaxID=143995 RepID=UPI0006150AB8|nr:PREDICTED: glucosylceramidase-like isoform X2 [Megachile rotundata]